MEKSNSTANVLRQAGNELYKKRNFFEALLKYNQSISFAENGTENLGLAYANRSAVYLEMKLNEKCLNNIELALENSYPETNKEILVTRREKCNELMKHEQKKKSENIFRLSLPTNKKLPFLADCLKIKQDEKYGRYIITTTELSVGDLIAIDKAFCSVPIAESRFVQVTENNIYQRCNNCLKSNSLDLIPCQKCCYAMFCSEDCRSFAMKFFHNYECPIVKEIIKSGSVNMTMRIFFICLSIFNEDLGRLRNFVEQTEKTPKNIFDFDFSSDEKSQNVENQLKCLLSLSRSSKSYPLIQQKILLSSHPTLQSLYKENSDFIDAFIQHQSQISDHNFHGIFSSNLNTQSLDESHLKSLQEPVGSGSFLFASLINHSCAPNILRICVDAEIHMIVCRRIEKGSQIFDCYKNNFLMENGELRRANLLKEFNFQCGCVACLNDWPTFKQLNVKDMKLMKYAKKVNDELVEMLKNHNQLLKNFKNCQNILNENHQNYPSMELCIIQKTFVTFLLKFAAQHNVQF